MLTSFSPPVPIVTPSAASLAVEDLVPGAGGGDAGGEVAPGVGDGGETSHSISAAAACSLSRVPTPPCLLLPPLYSESRLLALDL